MKTILKYGLVEVVFIVALYVMNAVYPSKSLTILAALCFVAFLFTLFVWLMNVKARKPEREISPFWQRIIRIGQRLRMVPTPCAPNSHFSDKEEIERRAHLQLPDFKVLSCMEMGPNNMGDFIGWMKIEFFDDFSPTTREKLRNLQRRNKVVLNLRNVDEVDQWNIELSLDSRKGVINYSRIHVTNIIA